MLFDFPLKKISILNGKNGSSYFSSFFTSHIRNESWLIFGNTHFYKEDLEHSTIKEVFCCFFYSEKLPHVSFQMIPAYLPVKYTQTYCHLKNQQKKIRKWKYIFDSYSCCRKCRKNTSESLADHFSLIPIPQNQWLFFTKFDFLLNTTIMQGQFAFLSAIQVHFSYNCKVQFSYNFSCKKTCFLKYFLQLRRK